MHIGRLNVQTAGSLPLIAGSVLLVTGLVALIVVLIGLSGVITLNRGFMITVSHIIYNHDNVLIFSSTCTPQYIIIVGLVILLEVVATILGFVFSGRIVSYLAQCLSIASYNNIIIINYYKSISLHTE